MQTIGFWRVKRINESENGREEYGSIYIPSNQLINCSLRSPPSGGVQHSPLDGCGRGSIYRIVLWNHKSLNGV